MQDINVMAYRSFVALKISLFFMVVKRSMLLVYSEVYSTSSAAYVCASIYLYRKIRHFVQQHTMTCLFTTIRITCISHLLQS